MKGNVIISGTGSGVGQAIAKLMLSKGYLVVGISRKNKINHSNFIFIETDLSSKEKLLNLKIPDFKNKNHTILINNAGEIGEIKPLGRRKNYKILLEYMVNIVAPTIIINKFLSNIKNENSIKHTIINISSGAAFNHIASWSTYCASKSALKMLNACINDEYNNIRAFSISPGIVDTDMQVKIRSAKKEEFALLENFKNYYKNGELEKPEIIAEKIVTIVENQNNFGANELSLRDITI